MAHADRNYASLALAGLVQATALVHALAHGRPTGLDSRRATLAAVLTHRAASLADVFQSPADFKLGTDVLRMALRGEAITPEIARYALQLMDLAGRLRNDQRMSARVGQLLDDLVREGTDSVDPGATELAGVYRQTVSGLGKRIQVTGDSGLLRQETTANEIRAQLLAGVRFAWLWRQLGGRRWHLILRRRSLLLALQTLMTQD